MVGSLVETLAQGLQGIYHTNLPGDWQPIIRPLPSLAPPPTPLLYVDYVYLDDEDRRKLSLHEPISAPPKCTECKPKWSGTECGVCLEVVVKPFSAPATCAEYRGKCTHMLCVGCWTGIGKNNYVVHCPFCREDLTSWAMAHGYVRRCRVG